MASEFLRIQIVAVLLLATVVFGLRGALVLAVPPLRRKLTPRWRLFAVGCVGALLCGVFAFAYGVLVEADWLEVTHTEVETAALPKGARLRFVHLTDLHVQDRSKALQELPEVVRGLNADVVVYTGDSLNSRDALPVFRDVMNALPARLGRFAVKGNHDVWYWGDVDLFGGGVAEELKGRPVYVDGGRVAFCGAPYSDEEAVTLCLAEAKAPVKVVLYHTPDLVEDVARLKPTLYFAGHTHGGQVRVPLYGAIATLSKYGKRYEMGAYRVADTLLYVSRGIGFEPKPAPRVRFLCRPEVAVIDLVGTGAPSGATAAAP